jgi:hypothetical protein
LRRIYARYQGVSWVEKQLILDEFCVNCDYHRKYAIRVLDRAFRPTENTDLRMTDLGCRLPSENFHAMGHPPLRKFPNPRIISGNPNAYPWNPPMDFFPREC